MISSTIATPGYVYANYETMASNAHCLEKIKRIFLSIINTVLYCLFVFATGLKSHRVWAAPYVKEIQQRFPNAEIRVPEIYKNGDAGLEDIAKPFTELVKNYIDTNPGKPICLIGTSNGGRIVCHAETALRTQQAAIRVVSIAGVLFGSDLMARWQKLAQLFLSKKLTEELSTASLCTQSLIEKMREDSLYPRSYEFYAASNDSVVPNSSSCLPLVGHDQRLHMVEGHGHLSILGAVQKDVLTSSFTWIDHEHQQ